MSLRLKSNLFVSAYLRRCQAAGAFAVIVKHGDEDAGILAIKVYVGGRKAQAFLESRTADGLLGWRDLSGGLCDEDEVDRLFEKELRFDPDLWVIEVEDQQGRHFLEEPILPLNG